MADRGAHCTNLPVLPRAGRLSFEVSADFRMAERQRQTISEKLDADKQGRPATEKGS